jgi:osmotically inducible lipoprotein OsmB
VRSGFLLHAAALPPDARRIAARLAWADPFNFKDFSMNTRLITSLGVALIAVSFSACSGMSTRDKNTATGAVIGGVAGAVLTGGSTVGTVGGAAVGGIIGNQVDKK